MKLVNVLIILLLVMAPFSMATDQNAPPPNNQAGEGAVAQEKAPEVIPTLGEWGLIILGVFLAGWMGWMIMRRKQKATAGF